MFEALRARFDRQARESRQLKRAKKVQSRKAREAHLNRTKARVESNDYGGGGGAGVG
jgi:hypothetical protein